MCKKGKSRNRQHRKETCKRMFQNKTKSAKLKVPKPSHWRHSRDILVNFDFDVWNKSGHGKGNKDKSALMELFAYNDIAVTKGIQYTNITNRNLEQTIKEYAYR